ncbi:MAG: hypothetical protein KJO43_06875 [Phycisphaerae bacterium]|nr:hypothetical protein [Phycisphaerae bacterium]
MGACCFEDGSCTDTTATGCSSLGGDFQGEGTTCARIECPLLGACCLALGRCLETTPALCEAVGGEFFGLGFPCASAKCVDLEFGICCFGSECVETSLASCDADAGVYVGSGVSCDGKICFTITPGGCCLYTGQCVEATAAGCEEVGGTFLGDFVPCGEIECVFPHGPCCLPDGSCGILSADECDAVGGSFAGLGLECDAIDCGPGFGACCIPGKCFETDESDCLSSGGVYQGDGTDCGGVSCPPFGACCITSGVQGFCIDTTEEECDRIFGVYFGDGSDCKDISCEVDTGACCFEGGACLTLSEADCDRSGGSFAGLGTDCRTTDCAVAGDIALGDPLEFVAAGEGVQCATGDLTDSGFRDVIVVEPSTAGNGPGVAQVFRNEGGTGDGWKGLTPTTPIPVGSDPVAVATGQLDGDGRLDAVVANRGDGTITVLFNTGETAGGGGLGDPLVIAVGAQPSDVVTGELTGDGVTDIAVALAGDDSVLILAGDGAGGFVEFAMLGGVETPIAVDPEDLEGDKDLDLVVGGLGGDVAGVFFQIPGGFSEVVLIPVGVDPADVTTGDVDGDGDADILTADRAGVATLGGGSTVSVIINNGDGTFMPSVQIPVGADARSIKAVDLDDDGDADIEVVADDPEAGLGIQVLESLAGEGAGPLFSLPIPFGVAADPNWIVTADMNLDGLIDLITCNLDDGATDGSVTVLINELQADCNDNGIADECDIATGTSEDCNGNGIPDECDTAVAADPATSVARDSCPDAEWLCPGFFYAGDTLGTEDDQIEFCGGRFGAYDVWYRYRPAWDGLAFVSFIAPGLEPVVHVFDGCPSDGGVSIACNYPNPNGVTFTARRGETYYVRFAGRDFRRGLFQMDVLGPDCLLNELDGNQNGIPDECECLADVTGDGVVDIADYLQVLLASGPCDGCPEDIDGSGVVDAADLQIVLLSLGPCPKPPDPPAGGCE